MTYAYRKSARHDYSWLQTAHEQIMGDMPFNSAADLWVGCLSGPDGSAICTARRIRKTTENSYHQYIGNLKLFFGEMPLRDIRLDHIRKYEDTRIAGAEPFIRKRRPGKNVEPAPCPAGPKKANQEIGILKRILKAANLWGEAQSICHRPLEEHEPDVPRALSRADQSTWLKVSLSYSRWHVVHWYSQLAFATCMSTNEIRSLRIIDINMESGLINIPWAGSKNRYRHRTVQIGAEGDMTFLAVQQLLSRAHDLGATEPQHFLFPFRRPPADFDPTRPMTVSGIKRLWDEVRQASGLKSFRPYDTRHTAITRLAEEGVPPSVIMDMAGHISEKMTRHYTHISDGLKLKAMRQIQNHASLTGGTGSVLNRKVDLHRVAPTPRERSAPVRQSFNGAAGFTISTSTFFVGS